jgi:hypothetical protein
MTPFGAAVSIFKTIQQTIQIMANTSMTMRVLHRYLGFFLVGIMAVYSLSGIVLIFRDTDFLKQEKRVEKQVKPQVKAEDLGKLLGIRDLKVEREEGNVLYFKQGQYDKATGQASYSSKQLPTLLDKMTHLHKAKSADPLFFLNVFFGASLFFFVLSSLWMFTPSTPMFRKGMYFTLGGIVLTLVLLLI